MVVQGTTFSEAWAKIWPEAAVRATARGSMTAELFVEFTLRWERYVRQDLKVSRDKELILLLDSGGGSLLHLSPDFTLACFSKKIRPLFFPPYSTSALCPADQAPNAQAELLWDKKRRDSNLSHLAALDVVHEVFDHAYCSKYIRSGFKTCGLITGQPLAREQIFGERGVSLFRTIVSAKEVVLQAPESEAVLQAPKGYQRAEAKVKCEACGKRTPSSLPKCGYCGGDNAGYNAVQDCVSQGLKHQGYTKKVPAVVDTAAELSCIEPAAKANLVRWSGDLLAEMRKRKNSEEAQGQPATKKVAAECASSASALPKDVPASDGPVQVELDLEDPADAEKFLLSKFKPEKREQLQPVARFYLQELKKGKKEPLVNLLRKEVIGPKMLDSAKGRQAWVDCWSANRALRFVTVNM